MMLMKGRQTSKQHLNTAHCVTPRRRGWQLHQPGQTASSPGAKRKFSTSRPEILLISVQRYASKLLGWWAAKGTSKRIAEGGMAESLRQHGVAFHPPNLVAQELSPKTLLQETSPSSFSSKKNLETARNKKRNQIKEILSGNSNTIRPSTKTAQVASPSNTIIVVTMFGAPSKSQGSASVSTPQPSSNSGVNRGAGSWNTFFGFDANRIATFPSKVRSSKKGTSSAALKRGLVPRCRGTMSNFLRVKEIGFPT